MHTCFNLCGVSVLSIWICVHIVSAMVTSVMCGCLCFFVWMSLIPPHCCVLSFRGKREVSSFFQYGCFFFPFHAFLFLAQDRINIDEFKCSIESYKVWSLYSHLIDDLHIIGCWNNIPASKCVTPSILHPDFQWLLYPWA